jgi:hypothetical protein
VVEPPGMQVAVNKKGVSMTPLADGQGPVAKQW